MLSMSDVCLLGPSSKVKIRSFLLLYFSINSCSLGEGEKLSLFICTSVMSKTNIARIIKNNLMVDFLYI